MVAATAHTRPVNLFSRTTCTYRCNSYTKGIQHHPHSIVHFLYQTRCSILAPLSRSKLQHVAEPLPALSFSASCQPDFFFWQLGICMRPIRLHSLRGSLLSSRTCLIDPPSSCLSPSFPNYGARLLHGPSQDRPLRILGLESSADDTCAAIVDSDRNILANVVLRQDDLLGEHQTEPPSSHRLVPNRFTFK